MVAIGILPVRTRSFASTGCSGAWFLTTYSLRRSSRPIDPRLIPYSSSYCRDDYLTPGAGNSTPRLDASTRLDLRQAPTSRAPLHSLPIFYACDTGEISWTKRL